MQDYFIPNNSARESLATKLNLTFHPGMQDWEYEVSDPNHLEKYISLYLLAETDDLERKALMEMMLDALEDSLDEKGHQLYTQFASEVFQLLRENHALHQGTATYWSNGDFLISPQIIAELSGSSNT